MSKSKTLFVLFASIAVLSAAIWILRERRDQESNPGAIRIGAIMPLTGPTAYLGDFCKNAMELAKDQVNRENGIAGSNLDIIFVDSKNEPKEGVSAFQKLQIEKPAAIVVGMSSVTNAVAPLADAAELPLFATMVSAKGVTDGHPMMFRLFINADIDARIMAEFAATKKKFETISIVAVNDEMGNSFSDVFSKTFIGLGGKIVLKEFFDKNASDFRDIAAKVAATPTDAVYLLGYDKNLGQLAKALREQGVQQPFLSIATIAQEPVRLAGGASLHNTYFTAVEFDAQSPSGAKAKAFVAEYEKRFGNKPTYFSAFAYDTILILADAMRSKGTQPKQVAEGLRATQSFDGTTGSISFSGTQDARFPMSVKIMSKDGISAAD